MLNNLNFFQTQPVQVPVTDSKLEVPLGRVVDVVLSENHPDFESLGKWRSIGAIKFRPINSPILEDRETNTIVAFPYSIDMRQLPIIGEIVELISGVRPNPTSNQSTDSKAVYYKKVLAPWNTPNHNYTPDYVQRLGEFDYGYGFEEQPDIAPLYPFAGDTIYQGRQGQSIRFTGTKHSNPNFVPVDDQNNGKPITVISNGQIETDNGFEHIVEDINQDASSIWMVSDHIIGLELATQKRDSFKDPVVEVDRYQGSQIAANADRVVINGRENDVLVSAKEHVGVNADIIGIDGKKYVAVDAKKIHLGKKALQEQQPVLRGEKTTEWLDELLDRLATFSDILKTMNPTDPIGSITKIQTYGVALQTYVSALKTKLPTLKSTKVYTE